LYKYLKLFWKMQYKVYSNKFIIAIVHLSYINSFCCSRVSGISRKGARYIHVLQGNIWYYSRTSIEKCRKVATNGRTGGFS